ncbi:MAG: hypothetical protein IPK32_24335 [Verrucomicrobiaceae bacterium]|nr:hypothetical protein [Verrucomicrobiaceae bacterium]
MTSTRSPNRTPDWRTPSSEMEASVVSRLPVFHTIGNLRREQIGHAEHLRMVSTLRAATRDAVADAESRIRLIHRDDDTCC